MAPMPTDVSLTSLISNLAAIEDIDLRKSYLRAALDEWELGGAKAERRIASIGNHANVRNALATDVPHCVGFLAGYMIVRIANGGTN